MRKLVFGLLFFGMLHVNAQQLPDAAGNNLIKTLFFSGLRDKLAENYAGAAESFSRIVTLDPTNAAAFYEISVLNYRQNKLVEAENAIKKAVALNKENVWYWKTLAEIYKRKGDMPRLVEVFNELIRLDPNNDAYYFDRSNAYAIAGKSDEALKSYQELEQKFGPSENLNKARARLTAVQVTPGAGDPPPIGELTDSSDPRQLMNIGDRLYRSGDLRGAETMYRKGLVSGKRTYLLWEKLLNVQTLLSAHGETIKTANEALALYPNQSILYYYLAFAQHRLGKNEAAQLNIKQATELGSDNPELQGLVYALQAEIYIDTANYKAAQLSFEKALTAAPENYLIVNNYVYYLALRDQELGKAESLIAKAVKAQPGNPSLADTYALVLFKQKKYSEARKWVEQALQNNEANNGVYLEHYGDILFMLNEQELGLKQWLKAQQNGNDAEILKRKINEKKFIK
ncbi:tetratricopeptide repeat protein [Pedobacter duraquae]|uniref:Tetratricopeptide repeat protein n=1 Tax=Pedobacter duraquae TaxID=425511 RepID=A0A4R6IDW2_9SPHI|nr:tetratricopeptide repeat protein [Pedobacter duraquae]TDO19095.1 tetratricopeptide repeat protein [Pedobacter duraquae]